MCIRDSVTGCDTFEFEDALDESGEGDIAFQLLPTGADLASCDLPDAVEAIDALERADYYAFSSRHDLMLWSGDQPLAAFTDMERYRETFEN